MLNKLIRSALLLALLGLTAHTALAAPPRQAPRGEEYIVQSGDWLSKIAEKYYGESVRYPTIIEATNAKANEDNSFAAIDDANFLRVGQKLWIPRLNESGTFNVGGITFGLAALEPLGIETVVPQNWPPVEESDPLLKHSWSAGIFSLVSFTTTPGNDPATGLARLLSVTRDDLTGGFLGGQLTQQTIGNYSWTIFTRDQGGTSSVVAATVQDKVIYQIRLFSETSQKEAILNTILENFEITDPLAARQFIDITAPAPNTSLTNPLELRGTTSQYPFKGRLIYRVLDAQGNQVGRGPFEVVGRIGEPSTFAVAAAYKVNSDGPGTVEVAEISDADNTIITIDSVAVNLLADPPGYTITIDDPHPYGNITSPVQIRGKTGNRPFEGRLNYRIVDAAGREISTGLLQSSGQIGEVNLFDGFAQFTVERDGPGRIEVFDIRPADGAVFAINTVNVWLVRSP